MIRRFYKAYVSPVRELAESIHQWPWSKPTLQRMTVPQECEGCTLWWWTCTDAGGWLTESEGYSRTCKSIGMQKKSTTLSQSRGSRTKRLTSSGMSLATQWMAVTFRAAEYLADTIAWLMRSILNMTLRSYLTKILSCS